jgi:hypothetical protein
VKDTTTRKAGRGCSVGIRTRVNVGMILDRINTLKRLVDECIPAKWKLYINRRNVGVKLI